MQVRHAIGAPVHGILLAFPVALFPSALLADIAYLRTAELQWTNFSAWLIAGGLVFTGLLLAWTLIALALSFRSPDRLRRVIYSGVLAVLFVVGLLNAFKHSQDGWTSVGSFGLILSILSTLLALGAAILAWSGFINREVAR
jgi:uncharacterized membrane protein